MADIEILAIGRLKQDAEAKLEARYLSRLQKTGAASGLRHVSVTSLTESRRESAEQRKSEEAARLLEKLKPGSFLIAMDEKGKHLTSLKFASTLKNYMEDGPSQIAFAIGGADGHGTDLLDKANLKLSLSNLTLPHGLARILLLEQLYRATTIWSNHPYHRE